MSRSKQARAELSFGPPLGVRNTTEPFDDAAVGDFCQDALNVYFRDPKLLSGAQSRPGFLKDLSVAVPPAANICGFHAHISSTVSTIGGIPQPTPCNFMVANGKLYRLDGATWTDVTPGTVAIDSTQSYVQMVSLGTDQMIVNDRSHKPWVATNLASTPVTGAYIDNGSGAAWSALGATVYQGSAVFLVLTASGVNAKPMVSITWSEPNQATVGYEQTGYANFANLIEQNQDGVFAIWGTNVGLFYWRRVSIGVLSGPLYNFTTSPTRDARADDVGSASQSSIAQFGDNIFFTDQFGRPYLMPLGGVPQPIWKQYAAISSRLVYPNSVGAIIPQMDAYALLSLGPAGYNTRLDVFDGETGNYFGRWSVMCDDATDGQQLRMIGQIRGSDALPVFIVNYGSSTTTALLANTDAVYWKDSGLGTRVMSSITTDRMGYNADVLYTAEAATIINTGPSYDNTPQQFSQQVTITTPYEADTVIATSQQTNNSQDDTYRTQLGLDVRAARGLQFTIGAYALSLIQWSFQRITVPVTATRAGPEDQ